MSHFVLFVITKDPDNVEQMLEPFNENTQVDRYKDHVDLKNDPFEIRWARRREHLIAFLKNKGLTEEQFYADTVQDPERAWHKNPGPIQQEFDKAHEDYRASWETLGKDEFTTDDLKTIASLISDDDDRYSVDSDGLFRWSQYNPKSKWDWWVVGGRWAGFFKLREGADGTRGRDGVAGSHRSEDGSDIVRVGDIDWDAMTEEVAGPVAARWDRVHAAVSELPPFPEEGDRSDFKAWWDHEDVIKASDAFKDPDDDFPFFGSYEDLFEIIEMERDEYIDYIKWSSVLPYAFLDDDGWHEPGRMGWWGMSTEDRQSRREFKDHAKQKIESLDPETYIVVVDCHI
jgi:hypothetical protein